MLSLKSAALRNIAEFFYDVPLSFVASNPLSRHASERRKTGMCVSRNTMRSLTARATTPVHDLITCTIEDPLGIVLARWWLRKRSVPELTNLEGFSSAQTTPSAKEEWYVLVKNCHLYLRCIGGAGTQTSQYVLSLGELMTFGIVERLDLSHLRLQATNEQLYPFLGQPVGLRVLRARHVDVDMGELFALLSANTTTLSIVELSSYELPTLQLFAFLPGITELELRNATILDRPVVVQAADGPVADLGASGTMPNRASNGERALAHLRVLQNLHKLDLSGLRSRLDFRGLCLCSSLCLLNLSSGTVTNKNVTEIAALGSLNDLFLSHTDVSDVTPLSACSLLQSLQLSHTDVTTEGIATLERLPNLRFLDLSYTKVTSVNSLSASKSLTTLNIWKTNVRAEGISLLGQLKTLQHLLAGDNDITEATAIQGCVSLRRVSLQSTLVGTEGIAGLQLLSDLEELNLSNTLVSDVSALSEAKSLKRLDLTGSRVTSQGLRGLSKLPLFDALAISKSDVENLDELAGCATLREVVGKRCRLTSLDGAGDLPRLTTLVATHCSVTSANRLSACKQLETINLWGSKITQDGISQLGECCQLRDVDLAETLVTSIQPLLACSQITTLVLYSSKVKTIDGIEALRNLIRLDIANTAVLQLTPLITCATLEVLNISDTDINDEGFRGVEQLMGLKSILLSSTNVTQIGQLGRCPELAELHASKCHITSAGIEGIERARKLEKLNLSLTEVGSGVTRLAWCRWLQKLNLKLTKVSREDVECLRSYLPKCRITAY